MTQEPGSIIGSAVCRPRAAEGGAVVQRCSGASGWRVARGLQVDGRWPRDVAISGCPGAALAGCWSGAVLDPICSLEARIWRAIWPSNGFECLRLAREGEDHQERSGDCELILASRAEMRGLCAGG